jgi:hypothetical protein
MMARIMVIILADVGVWNMVGTRLSFSLHVTDTVNSLHTVFSCTFSCKWRFNVVIQKSKPNQLHYLP